LRQAVPIILSGGSFLAAGSFEKFSSMLQNVKLPFDILDIVLSKDPLHATAKGAFQMAMGKASV
jgi:hypothetical protein